MSNKWIEHLNGLAELEANIGKKVAFKASADKIQDLEKQVEAKDKEIERLKEWVDGCKDVILYPLSHEEGGLSEEADSFGAASVELLKE